MTQQLAGKHVLIVEDDNIIAMNFACEFSARGAKVIGPVGIVIAALDLIATTYLDGAIVDLNLRGKMAFRWPMLWLIAMSRSSS